MHGNLGLVTTARCLLEVSSTRVWMSLWNSTISFPPMKRASLLFSIGHTLTQHLAQVPLRDRSSNDNEMCCVQGNSSATHTLSWIADSLRFIHLRLLLFRPMFTQLCSEERLGTSRQFGHDADKGTSRPDKNIIYSSMSVNCAAACVTAAVELVSHVYETYRTSLTDAWWYNGFCKLTLFPSSNIA